MGGKEWNAGDIPEQKPYMFHESYLREYAKTEFKAPDAFFTTHFKIALIKGRHAIPFNSSDLEDKVRDIIVKKHDFPDVSLFALANMVVENVYESPSRAISKKLKIIRATARAVIRERHFFRKRINEFEEFVSGLDPTG